MSQTEMQSCTCWEGSLTHGKVVPQESVWSRQWECKGLEALPGLQPAEQGSLGIPCTGLPEDAQECKNSLRTQAMFWLPPYSAWHDLW